MCGVHTVCEDVNECDIDGVPRDCGGDSSCANGLNQYTCNCAAGWTGGGINTVCTGAPAH